MTKAQPHSSARSGTVPVPPPARLARALNRHRTVLITFVAYVLLPLVLLGVYLFEKAEDQYASTVAFSVRKEEGQSAIQLLGGISDLSGSGSSDTDILYEFLQSQKLVSAIDTRLDLASIWSRPSFDPIFRYDASGSIEDLVRYWRRMVRVSYDSGTKLIEIRVLAFHPNEAQAIAAALFDESSKMINALSAAAREDAVRYAREELDAALIRLKSAREAVTRFRNLNQIVDPSVDMQTQAGLLGRLQGQLAEALIEVDLLGETTRAQDPRIVQAQRRVEVIRSRIAEERAKLGMQEGGNKDVFAEVVGEYERLIVDREFAEQTYTSALAAFDAARAEARRKSRYLAAHIEPTLAERAEYPRRLLILSLTGLFLFMLWGIVTLTVFSFRDRR